MTNHTNGEISYEALHEMTYLNQVVNGKLIFSFNNSKLTINPYRNPQNVHTGFC